MSQIDAPETYWSLSTEELHRVLDTGGNGLSSAQAQRRRVPTSERMGLRPRSDVGLLLRQFRSPLILLLLGAAAISMALAERVDSMIILLIVIGSGILGFLQERGAVRVIEALRDLVTVHVDVLRDGRMIGVTLDDVVAGDVVHLRTGDVVPGDCVVVSSNRLTVDESVITGEPFPVHKESGALAPDTPVSARRNCLHLGSHVASGSATAIVVLTGRNTAFGSIEERVAHHHLPTSFERGVTAYGMLLIKATSVLVVAVLILNLVLDRSVSESVMFSLALAVGIAPQMLPAIVTLSLSIGARVLAGRNVIVKRLDAIEDFGSVDVLCTDKTGTLTEGTVRLAGAVDGAGRNSERVLQRAYWNAHLQQDHVNPIDEAIVGSFASDADPPVRLYEIPFDFSRRLVSVAVETEGERVLISKGAFEQILQRCTHAEVDHRVENIASALPQIRATFEKLSSTGLRVLGIAEKVIAEEFRVEDVGEESLVFVGFVAFDDPTKPDAGEAIARLKAAGVTVKIVTGDNRAISQLTAEAVGLDSERILTGADIGDLSDEDLADAVEDATLFVEVDPLQKERIVRALSSNGHTVGFVGDGVNDVAALHAADVGISVDTGVDVTKKTADLILLDKSLAVISDGIQQGRRVFVNTLTYVTVTTSANFGNMVSLACATAFLPFLPMLPLQILLLNFLSDVPGMTIASDNVDAERLVRPQRWSIDQVRRFMIVFGLLSTSVDLATFAVLRLGFLTDAADLRTGWFLVSVLTEVVAMLFLRTPRHVHKSRPGRALGVSSALVVAITFLLVTTGMGAPFRLTELPHGITAVLIALVGTYAVTTELLKVRLADLFR